MRELIDKARRVGRRIWNRARWTLMANGLPRGPNGERMVHVGCGGVVAPGFINMDARRMPHIHFIIHGIAEVKFLPPESIDLIYLSHVLEHVPHSHVVAVLEQFHRVLHPGGRCRVSVPDFDLLLDIYRIHDQDLDRIVQPLMGGQDFPQNFHFSAFNEALLTKRFLAAGFAEVHRWDPANCDHHDFEDWASRQLNIEGRSYPVSLNLEAVKA